MRLTTLAVAMSLVAVLTAACSSGQGSPSTDRDTVTVPGDSADSGGSLAPQAQALLEQARAANSGRYAFAIDHGAQVVGTSDGRSFAVVWFPPGAGDEKPPVIATIHGHDSWAFDEFFLWQPYAAERGYGIVALQWWLGEGERYEDYYSPGDVNREVSIVLDHENVEPGTVLFHGFSRGSANSYAVVAYDNSGREGYYLLAVANAGKPGLEFPDNVAIASGILGPPPLAGTHWVTFCGGKDEHPERDGCAGMREAAAWIDHYGGSVLKAIDDPNGDHGGFHRSPANVDAALDIFAGLLSDRGGE